MYQLIILTYPLNSIITYWQSQPQVNTCPNKVGKCPPNHLSMEAEMEQNGGLSTQNYVQ